MARKKLPSYPDRQSLVSLGLGAVVVVIIGLLVFNYFSRIKQQLPAPKKEGVVREEIATEEKEPKEPEEKKLPVEHTVVEGESLWKLAQKYYHDGYKWLEIARANPLSNPNLIYPGQKLTIPQVESQKTLEEQIEALGGKIEGNQYIVQRGDDLCKIAIRAYGECSKGWEIARANHLANPHLIHAGNVLKIPRE